MWMGGEVVGYSWHDIRVLHLFIKTEEILNIQPGSFIQLKYKGVIRAYDIVNYGNTNIIELFIALKNNGQMSKLLENIKLNDKMEISKPISSLKINNKKILFISGGTGISKFLPIMRAYENNELDLDEVWLFHSSRKISEFPFLKEILRYNKVKAVLTFTREKTNEFLNERITKHLLEKYLDLNNYDIYICGPKQFVENIKNDLKKYRVVSYSW